MNEIKVKLSQEKPKKWLVLVERKVVPEELQQLRHGDEKVRHIQLTNGDRIAPAGVGFESRVSPDEAPGTGGGWGGRAGGHRLCLNS